MARDHQLVQVQDLARPRDQVFAFFEDAHNLERITPDFLHFEILTAAPIEMREGARIDYRLRLYGLPTRWETRIEAYVRGERFVDTQRRGPYRRWRHLHLFEDLPGGTRMTDVVDYQLPLGWLGEAAHALVVRRTLARIFAHRRRVIDALFGHPR